MSPKANKPVRCFIWQQTLEYWEEGRQEILKELLQKIRSILNLAEEIHQETEKLKRTSAETEITESLSEIFAKVSKLKRQNNFEKLSSDPNQPPNPVEILSNILLKSAANRNMANKTVILKRVDSSEEGHKENCRQNQSTASALDLTKHTAAMTAMPTQGFSGATQSGSTRSQPMEVLTAHGGNEHKFNFSLTAQDFISKLTSASREVVLEPAVREYNAQLLQFVSTNGPQALEQLLVDLLNVKTAEKPVGQLSKRKTIKPQKLVDKQTSNPTVAVNLYCNYNQLLKGDSLMYLPSSQHLLQPINSKVADFSSIHSGDVNNDCGDRPTVSAKPAAQQYLYMANTPSTSSTGSNTPESEGVEFYAKANIRQEVVDEAIKQKRQPSLCVDLHTSLIDLLGQGLMCDDPGEIEERILKIFDDNLEVIHGIEWVRLGPNNTRISKSDLCTLDWRECGQTLTGKLLIMLFGHEGLATRTLAGKPSKSFVNFEMPGKLKLDPLLISDVTHFMNITKGLSANDVRHCIALKCAEESQLKRRLEQIQRDQNQMMSKRVSKNAD